MALWDPQDPLETKDPLDLQDHLPLVTLRWSVRKLRCRYICRMEQEGILRVPANTLPKLSRIYLMVSIGLTLTVVWQKTR